MIDTERKRQTDKKNWGKRRRERERLKEKTTTERERGEVE